MIEIGMNPSPVSLGSIEIGIDPDIVSIGSYDLSWHGLFVVLAVIVGVGWPAYWAKRAGIPRDTVYSVALWAVPGGIVGARLVHVLDDLDHYINNPGQVFDFWEGGVSVYGAILGGIITALIYIYGAILGGIITALIYIKLKELPFNRLADLTAPGLLLAQAVGRVGCTINGDAYGTPTSLPWGFIYTHPGTFAERGVAGHPAPVYEILWDLLAFAVVWRLRDRLKPEGSLLLFYLALYSFGRFFISFVREEPERLGPLHQAHLIALLVMAIAIPLLIYRTFQEKARLRALAAGDGSEGQRLPE
jgi:phosphatidylglycerol:prolipoprotein diacylglycerol transferase